ncbi:MAG: acyl-[acyl-carrier-protein] thioesterase [Lactobacillus sp.]
MSEEYSETRVIEFSDCDENRRLKIPAMIAMMLQTSEHQLAQADIDADHLVKQERGWVVTQYHFELNKSPHPRQRVIIKTLASGYNRFFTYRDFKICDENGDVLVQAMSRWVLFDLHKRTMIPTDMSLMTPLEVPLMKRLPHFAKIRRLPSYQQERQYRVRYDDIDTNHHLTNSHYFSWLIDLYDRDFLRTHVPATIDVQFDKEVLYGESPIAYLTLTDGIAKQAIISKDGREHAVCQIAWRLKYNFSATIGSQWE